MYTALTFDLFVERLNIVEPKLKIIVEIQSFFKQTIENNVHVNNNGN